MQKKGLYEFRTTLGGAIGLNISNTVLLFMKIRTVKGVDDETWKIFKEIASMRKLKMGSMLREIAKEYKRRPSDAWEKILNAKPILTKNEADDMLRMVAKMRKERGYREF